MAKANRDLPDQDLWELCRQDDQQAYELLFERYFRRLYSFCLDYLKDTGLAEELVMDVLLNLWLKRKELNLYGNLLPYLFRAVRNRVISQLRKNAIDTLSLECGDAYSIPSQNADHELLQDEWEAIYRSGLEQLSPQRRRVFELNRFEDKSYLEIAQQLNLSPRTVRNHMHASLRFFREYLLKHTDAMPALFFVIFLNW